MMMGFRFKSWADGRWDRFGRLLGFAPIRWSSIIEQLARLFQAVRGLEHEELKSLFASFQFDLIDDELQY